MKSYNKGKSQTPEFESEASLGKRLKKETKQQLELARDDFFEQLLGGSIYGNKKDRPQESKTEAPRAKSLKEEVVFQLFNSYDKAPVKKQAERSKEPGISYHGEYRESVARSGERLSNSETREIREQVKQIMNEIRRLAASTKELKFEFGKITVEQAPENPGKYYISFFEWLLIMLRQSRQKVEDSKAWLDTVKTKSAKKMGYWGKSKKFGTSFSQSNERAVATSTG